MAEIGSQYVTPGRSPIYQRVPASNLAAIMSPKPCLEDRIFFYIFLVDRYDPTEFDQIITTIFPMSDVSKQDAMMIGQQELEKVFVVPKEIPFIYDRTIMDRSDIKFCIEDFRCPSKITQKFTRI